MMPRSNLNIQKNGMWANLATSSCTRAATHQRPGMAPREAPSTLGTTGSTLVSSEQCLKLWPTGARCSLAESVMGVIIHACVGVCPCGEIPLQQTPGSSPPSTGLWTLGLPINLWLEKTRANLACQARSTHGLMTFPIRLGLLL